MRRTRAPGAFALAGVCMSVFCVVGSARAAAPVTRQEAAPHVLPFRPDHHAAPGPLAQPSAPAEGTLSHVVFGYYPDFVGDDFSSVRFDLLSHVGYFTGGCTADGGYSSGAWPFDAFAAAARAEGTRVMLVVPCFSEARIHAILTEPATRQAFLDGVVAAFAQGTPPADGVDVDFEGMANHHLADYPAFLADLALAIRTVKPDAELSAALPAVDWGGAYDYAALAEVLDRLVIMGYDYHWKGGDPGPVAPLDYAGAPWTGYSRDLFWSIDDYLTSIGNPAKNGKVVLALPWYGYDWPSTSHDVPGTKTANATARRYAAAMSMAETAGYDYDESSQSNVFFYEDAGQPHQLWFDDADTLAAKFEAARLTGLGGVGIWALRYDDGRPELWDAVAGSFLVPAEAPTPTPTPDPSGFGNVAFDWRADGGEAGAGGGCNVTPASPYGAAQGAAFLVAVFLSYRMRRRSRGPGDGT